MSKIANLKLKKIRGFAPSSQSNELNELIPKAKQSLKDLGLEWVLPEIAISQAELPFFASPLNVRQQDILNAIQEKDTPVMWAVRGGYGAAQLVKQCMGITPYRQKTLIGFSDITALHVLFNQHYMLPTIHGHNMSSCYRSGLDFSLFFPILQGETIYYDLLPFNKAAKNFNSSLKAPIFGGNLTVLASLIGTSLNPLPAGKIFLLEDVHEKGYQLHRHLTHLKEAGLFADVPAIILGDFTEGDDLVWPALEQFFTDIVPLPVFRLEGIGHGEINHPIVLGTFSTLSEHKLSVRSPFSF